MKSMLSVLSSDLNITFGIWYFFPKTFGMQKVQDIGGGVERWTSPLKSFQDRKSRAATFFAPWKHFTEFSRLKTSILL